MEAGAITNPPVTKEPNIVALFVTCPRFGRRAVPHRVRPFCQRPIGEMIKSSHLLDAMIHPGAADCKRFFTISLFDSIVGAFRYMRIFSLC